MRRTRPQMGKAHHALDLSRVEDGAGTGSRGGLARLVQSHPSAPIVICGLKAGISKPGANTKSTRGTNGTRGLGSTGLPVSEVLRLPMTPGASRSPGVSEISATLLMPSTLLVLRMGRTGPIPTIWAGGMKVLPRTLSHFSPTKLYEKQKHHLDKSRHF